MKSPDAALSRRRRVCLVAAVVILAVGIPVGSWLQSNIRVAYDDAQVPCLPHRLYVLSLGETAPARGELAAFRTVGLEPWFDDGTVFTKMVVGVPGDEVVIDGGYVQVAGEPLGGVSRRIAEALDRTVDSYNSRYVLGPDQYFLAGTQGEPFDSRYYGPIEGRRLIAQAYPIW